MIHTELKKATVNWNELKADLKNVVSAKDWNVLDNATFEGNIGNNIYLKALTNFEKTILNKYISKINEALFYNTGVKYIVSLEKKPSEETVHNYNDTFLSRDYAFENFVIGNYNNDVKNAAKTLVERPELTNILFVYGTCGVGKTHMLHAIGNYIFDTYKDKKILYLKTDDLNRKIYSVIKDSDRIEALKDELTNYDVILVDDIQMIQNKGKIGEIAFYAYNKFIDSKKIIIVTSDISPDELKIEKRVISRLTSGLVQHMSTPDVETIKKIINLKIKNENFSFTADAIEWITARVDGDIRKINSIVVKLIFYSLNNHIELLTRSELEKIFKADIESKKMGFEVAPKHIIETICQSYKLPVETAKSKTKVKQVSLIRNICFWVIKKKCHGLSLAQIGSYLGRPNHSTVLEGIKKVDDMIKEDPNFGNYLDTICKSI